MTEASLSVIIPCFGEAATIDRTLDSLEQLQPTLARAGVSMQVVAVDDGSADGTYERLVARADRGTLPLVALRHAVNRGKGAAIRTARVHATGQFVVFQDADMELDPREIPRVIAPLLDGRADAVLGSRFLRSADHQVVNFWHRLGNKVLTYASNMFTGLDLTDMETGYKAFTASTFRHMHLTSDRFGIEPEIVARLAQMRARLYEVPVSYRGRTYSEGKKITWRDGVAAFGHIWRAHRTAAKQSRLPGIEPVPTSPTASPLPPRVGHVAVADPGVVRGGPHDAVVETSHLAQPEELR